MLQRYERIGEFSFYFYILGFWGDNYYNTSKPTEKIPGVSSKKDVNQILAKITLQPGKDSSS